jgi:hypothetical protein
MSEVFFEILSPAPLNREQDAVELFQLWFDKAPGFFPDRAGGFEPLRQKLTIDAVRDVLQDWSIQFFTKRVAQPKLQSSIFMQYGPHRKHATWKIRIQDHVKFDQGIFEALLRCAANKFAADFGFIHVPTTIDVQRGRRDGTVGFLDMAKSKKTFSLRRLIYASTCRICIG